MRKTLTAVLTLAMAFSLMAGPVLAENERPSEQDVLDQDEIDVDAVDLCPAPPEGVDVVGDDEVYYRVNWAFDTPPDPNLIVWEEGERVLDMTDNVGADGNLYLFNPDSDSAPRVHDEGDVEVTYYLVSGDIASVVAQFDDDGCLTDVDWDEDAADVSVAFTDPDGPVEVEVGEAERFEVTTTNNAEVAFPNEWRLGLEVDGDVTSADDITLEWGGNPVDTSFDEDEGILYVLGEVEDALLDETADVQEFDATFHEEGSFTGTVFAINTGSLHDAILDSYSFTD